MPAMLVARLLPSRPHLNDWPRPQQPAPSLKVLFLLAVLVSSSFPQSVPGYSNVNFVLQPEDQYSLIGTSAAFDCLAQGVADDTGNLEYLDLQVYFNDQYIDKFNSPPGMEVLQEYQKVAGLLIKSTELQDNNASVYCKVEDSEAPGLFSRTALLIVADGEPAAVVPTQVHQGLYDIQVTWEPALVPMEGPVLNYTASLTGPVQQQKETAADVTSLHFEGLLPAKNYSLTVVASNEYGEGNVTTVTVSTKSPVVPTAPESVSVESFPAHSALVTWMAVVINNQTMTPVIYYNIAYFPVGSPALLLSKNTVDANELQMMLYNLTLGEVYTIKVSAVNSAGQGEPFSLTTSVVPVSVPSSTQATPNSATPIQLFTQSAQFSSLSSSPLPTSSGTSASQTSSSTSTTSTGTTTTSTGVINTSSSSSYAVPISTSSTKFVSSTSLTISTTSRSTDAFPASSGDTSSTSSPIVSVGFPSTTSSSSKSTSTKSSTHSTTSSTLSTSLHSSFITYSVSALPGSSVVPPHNSHSSSSAIPVVSSPSSELGGTESTSSSGSSTSSPSGSGLLLIIVPAVIAGLIVIAIIIIAIMIIVMCVLSIRKDSTDFIGREISSGDSSWQTQRHSSRKPKEKEHEASLKESYSGSTDRSFGSSDSSEMPTLAIHSTSSSATNGNYCVTIPDEDGTTV